ncbi:MAG TPA: 4a-hydroxytetrahydrobiopterin dehydratase [Actinomycetes bacterium]
MAAIDVEHFRALRELPGWQRHGNTISKTFGFDDFAAAMRFVDRVALAAVATGHQPAMDVRGERVTVAFTPKQGHTLTLDDLAAARRVQRLIGDHRPPVGRAGPWSPTVGGRRPEPPSGGRHPPTPGAGPTEP